MRAVSFLSKAKTATAKTITSRATALYAQSSSETHANCDFRPSENHYISLVHACRTTAQLKQIHAQLFVHNLSQSSRVITQLISTCSLFKSMEYAVSVFRHFHDPNSFIFNALIRGLCESSQYQSSIEHFILMLRFNVQPDRLTFPFVLKAVASLVADGLGGLLHAQTIKYGLELDSFVRISIVDMYVKLRSLDSALQLFGETPERNKLESILLWNILINGCSRTGDLRKARELFDTMPERNTGSWNSMINGFIKQGDLEQARVFFDRMPDKNVISWTTMISGLSEKGNHELALDLFNRMLREGGRPNDLTIASALSACSKIGALEAGVRIHEYVSRHGFQLNRTVGTALVDMYAKCGKIDCASRVFDETVEKDLLTWSAMVSGWAIHGCSEQALQCFEAMKSTGIHLDEVAFLAVLTACSHSGLVDQGLSIFNSMRHDYFIEPNVKHYTCMVDLYGRASRLEEALSFIRSMPIEPDFVIWGALFCACRLHKNIKMAELASERLLQMEPKHPGSYVFLSNIYAGVGRWEDVERVRITMKNKGIEKPPGWSYIEVAGRVHSFVAGDRAHDCAGEIYAKLEELSARAKAQGYMPNTESVLHNIEEEEKEVAMGSHSEKLALAYGLISTPLGTALRIVKNLKVCGDCHSMMKFASEMSQREIILRDIKRFHHFKEGVCSCGDYW
ncbi:pentatricopeptide repeat-containing protein At1g04840-like [Telopea speciosissima]|uniref:pentatricopeptide repeat-containing protein At1g04840-like n=1 Tax=Telopea speciosissima TaxID=54955 RepID=UPI001CC753CC|nr:pentatricopeptide repeat-containing protein At1g04840-like [Telopea speciosissima]